IRAAWSPTTYPSRPSSTTSRWWVEMAGWTEAASIVGVHHPGRSLLHRAPAGAKVGGLLAAVGLVLLVGSPWPAAALAGLSVLVLASTRVPMTTLARPLRAV